MPLLEVDAIDAYYGRAQALHGVSLRMDAGEVVCVLGANGAGKTTLLKTISGLLRPAAGSIRFDGHAIDRLSPREIVRLGLAHSPEGRKIFAGLTVQENLEVGTASWRRRHRIDKELDYAYEMFPHLASRRRQLGWSLSGGEQQMLAIARALMARPRLLVLDEPSLGLAPMIVQDVFARIKEINARGIAVLLVEQNARMAVEAADRGYLLQNGHLVFEGRRAELIGDARVKDAYLGH